MNHLRSLAERLEKSADGVDKVLSSPCAFLPSDRAIIASLQTTMRQVAASLKEEVDSDEEAARVAKAALI